jgi:hypothetical protein
MAMLVGVLGKETTLLLWPLLWLADHIAMRRKLIFIRIIASRNFCIPDMAIRI